jgi:two-component system, NtrC family, response regulator HydG
MNASVLVIDDDEDACALAEDALSGKGYRVFSTTDVRKGLTVLADGDFDAVLTDLHMGAFSGLQVCEWVRDNRPAIPVIVCTAFGDLKAAVGALRAGAYDFITKPYELPALVHALERAVQHYRLQEEVKRLTAEVTKARGGGDLVGRSPVMRKVYDVIQRVSGTDASILITGESGTGKELVARALHTDSPRKLQPFLAINCAAVPSNLLESELFGHVRGAFTDAKTARRGLFQQANQGTIFLDELGEMPADMQAKLLRVIQERKVRPVGGNEEIPFDCRIVAATNRDLEEEVEEGRFREDLYYRLNVVQIHVPPLRARGGDILLLAQNFIEKAALKMNKAVRGITPAAARKLLQYEWPGNVRQLENWMERAVTFTHFEEITVEDLPDKISSSVPTAASSWPDVDDENLPTMQEVETRYMERVLKATGGNKAQTARILGMDRRTLYRKLDRLIEAGQGLKSENPQV